MAYKLNNHKQDVRSWLNHFALKGQGSIYEIWPFGGKVITTPTILDSKTILIIRKQYNSNIQIL